MKENKNAIHSVADLSDKAAALEAHARRMRSEAQQARQRIQALAAQLQDLPLVDILTDLRRMPRLLERGSKNEPLALREAAE